MDIIDQSITVCDAIAKLNSKYGEKDNNSQNSPILIDKISEALNTFMECVRYLNTRRSTSTILKLDSEEAVQDAIYLMLRPWISDFVPENPTDRVGNRYAIKDFLCPSAKTIIEAKYIRDNNHGKNITKELHDDIEMYRHHPHCRNILFFIYDPDALIPDQMAVRRQICTERSYDGKPLTCHLIIKP